MFKITLKFLETLKENNSTERLHMYHDLYKQERGRFLDFVQQVLDEIKKDQPDRRDLTLSDCTYRFNNDLRFMKDKKPYKEHLSAVFSGWGKKSDAPCFYIHLQPWKSFFGGGVRYPYPQHEESIRLYILTHFEEWKKLLADRKLRSYYSDFHTERAYKSIFVLKTRIMSKLSKKQLSKIDPLLVSLLLWKYSETMDLLSPLSPKEQEPYLSLCFFRDRIFGHPVEDQTRTSKNILDQVMDGYFKLKPVLNFFEKSY